MRYLIIVLGVLVFSGCTQVTYNGKCLTCGEMTMQANTSEYKPVNHHDMMKQYLNLSNTPVDDDYAHDYLAYKMGITITSIQKSEFTYRREIAKAREEFAELVANHDVATVYQVTVPAKLNEYDFAKQAFPIDKAGSIYMDSGNLGKKYPRKVTISFENTMDIPDLQLGERTAEQLKNAVGSRIYVRYIFSVAPTADSQTAFTGTIHEVQFIDVAPSITTKNRKEQYKAFHKVAI